MLKHKLILLGASLFLVFGLSACSIHQTSGTKVEHDNEKMVSKAQIRRTTNYLSHHMSTLNNRDTLDNRKGMRSAFISGNFKPSTTYHMIFYTNDCPYCKRRIPKSYLVNNYKRRFVIYKDVSFNSNHRIAKVLRVKSVPTQVSFKLNAKGKVTHYHQYNKLD